MKSRMMFVLCILAVSVFAAPAFAAGPYVGGEAGPVFLSDSSNPIGGRDVEFDTGYGLGAFGGYDFGTWRLEGELSYRKNDLKDFDGDISSSGLIGNAYYDFRMVSPSIVPYLGGGLGFADVSLEAPGVDDDDVVFAYQLAAGVGFVMNKQVTIDLGYKYFATSDPEFATNAGKREAEYKSHNLFLGARYNF